MRSALAALVIGVVIYLTTRDGLVLHAFGSLHLDAPSVVAYQLPDALWQFAFCMAVFAIWRDRRALLVPLALGLVAECVVGTFDPLDVMALVSGFAASWLATARASGRQRRIKLRTSITCGVIGRTGCNLPSARARRSSRAAQVRAHSTTHGR